MRARVHTTINNQATGFDLRSRKSGMKKSTTPEIDPATLARHSHKLGTDDIYKPRAEDEVTEGIRKSRQKAMKIQRNLADE